MRKSTPISIDITEEFLKRELAELGSAVKIAAKYQLHPNRFYAKCKEFKILLDNKRGNKRHPQIDLTGKVFTRLTVISKVLDECGNKWNCKCSCGNILKVRGIYMLTGKTKSCGCYHKDAMWKGYGDISNSYWYSISKSAEKRGHEFLITKEYAWDIFLKQNRKCALTGLPLVFIRSYVTTKQSASLDRIENNKGYIEGNIQWVDKRVNCLKTKYSSKDFILICKCVADYSKDNIEKDINVLDGILCQNFGLTGRKFKEILK